MGDPRHEKVPGMPDRTDSPGSSSCPVSAAGSGRAYRPGSAAPERLVGHHATGTHQDVVSIDLTDEKMHTIGARFAPGDGGRPAAPPVRGPVDGPPDEVLLEVLEWPERD